MHCAHIDTYSIFAWYLRIPILYFDPWECVTAHHIFIKRIFRQFSMHSLSFLKVYQYLCIIGHLGILTSVILLVQNLARRARPFTILQNDNIMISWDFLRLKAPVAMPGHFGTVSLKKSHDIVILSFCNIEPVFLVLRVWLLLVWELQVTK